MEASLAICWVFQRFYRAEVLVSTKHDSRRQNAVPEVFAPNIKAAQTPTTMDSIKGARNLLFQAKYALTEQQYGGGKGANC